MNSVSGRDRLVAGMIALIAWLGLAVQFQASLGQLGAVPETVWVMFRYYTVIANTLAAVVFSGLALGRRGFATPFQLGGVTVAMLLVGIIYYALLRGMIELSGGAKLADLLLHSAMPVLVPAYWLFFAPKGGLGRRDPLIWALLPVVYFAYALIRGAAEGVYAYPFMNLERLGWARTATIALVMAVCFLAAGFAMAWLDRVLSRPGTKPA